MIIFVKVHRTASSRYGVGELEIRGDLISKMQYVDKPGAEGTWITFTNGERLLVQELPEVLRDTLEDVQKSLIDRHATAILRGADAVPRFGAVNPLD